MSQLVLWFSSRLLCLHIPPPNWLFLAQFTSLKIIVSEVYHVLKHVKKGVFTLKKKNNLNNPVDWNRLEKSNAQYRKFDIVDKYFDDDNNNNNYYDTTLDVMFCSLFFIIDCHKFVLD